MRWYNMNKSKQIFTAFFMLLMLASCGGEAETTEEIERDGIKISGNLEGAENQKISLWVFENGEERLVDSVTTTDGSFEMWTDTKELREYVLDIGTTRELIYLFPDENSGTVELTGSYPGLAMNYDIKGDQNSKDYRDYMMFLKDFMTKENSIKSQLNITVEAEGKQSLLAELDSIGLIQKEYAIDYINEKPASPVSWIMLQEFYPPSGLATFDSTDLDYFDKVEAAMREKYPYSEYPDYVQESKSNTLAQLDQIRNGGGGDLAPEINFADPDGKMIALSSLRGKVVLIDFWASWCGPCRMENPNVVKTYEKYKDKGFTVYSVSLDTDKNKWKQAIEADNLVWPNHVSDLKGWQSAAAAKYNVNSIPATFLLDKDGRIIDQNLRGGALEQKLQEILG